MSTELVRMAFWQLVFICLDRDKYEKLNLLTIKFDSIFDEVCLRNFVLKQLKKISLTIEICITIEKTIPGRKLGSPFFQKSHCFVTTSTQYRNTFSIHIITSQVKWKFSHVPQLQ